MQIPGKSPTTTDRVNIINIGLMVLATVAAFVIPFQLFLFAYAVLGPAHYLTEISWLHDRHYFVKDKYDYLLLMLLCVPISVSLLPVSGLAGTPRGDEVNTAITYIAFLGALAMILLRNASKVIGIVAVVLTALVSRNLEPFQLFFLIFLPTLVHVFVFTAAFILIGALRGRSRSGIASLAVFAACAVSFFVYAPDSGVRELSHYVRDSYAPFAPVNVAMMKLLNLGPPRSMNDIYYSQYGLVVMRFIAFAYFYHYLNWFSKTSIIKWNRISVARKTLVTALWLASLLLYAYSYRVGFMALTLLSLMHVFLEFPLDHQTFINVGRELVGWRIARAVEA